MLVRRVVLVVLGLVKHEHPGVQGATLLQRRPKCPVQALLEALEDDAAGV